MKKVGRDGPHDLYFIQNLIRFAIIFGIKPTFPVLMRTEKRLNRRGIIYGISMPRRKLRVDGSSAPSIGGWRERRKGLHTLVYAGAGLRAYGIPKPLGQTYLLFIHRRIFLVG